MKYIAHRGNINGPNPQDENKPSYIEQAIHLGYYVEIDLWFVNNMLFLGHDVPQYKIDADFLYKWKDKLFCHCKNIPALEYVLNNIADLECFSHDKDDCVLTSKNNIWTYPGKDLTPISFCVMPECADQIPVHCLGVCTDYPKNYST